MEMLSIDSNGKNGNYTSRKGNLAVNFRRFVIIAELSRPEVERPGNFVSNFCVFFKKRSLSNCRYCADRAQNVPGPAPHLAYTVPDFIQIGSLSAELLPNA